MLSLIDTRDSSLLSIATQTLKPSGKLTLSLESQVKGTPIGICVEGASVHKFLVLIDSATFCQEPPAAEVDAFSQLSCCAFEGNPLGLRAGEAFTLSLTFAESTARANLGIAITDVGAFAVHANAEASQEPLKKKARRLIHLCVM